MIRDCLVLRQSIQWLNTIRYNMRKGLRRWTPLRCKTYACEGGVWRIGLIATAGNVENRENQNCMYDPQWIRFCNCLLRQLQLRSDKRDLFPVSSPHAHVQISRPHTPRSNSLTRRQRTLDVPRGLPRRATPLSSHRRRRGSLGDSKLHDFRWPWLDATCLVGTGSRRRTAPCLARWTLAFEGRSSWRFVGHRDPVRLIAERNKYTKHTVSYR